MVGEGRDGHAHTCDLTCGQGRGGNETGFRLGFGGWVGRGGVGDGVCGWFCLAGFWLGFEVVCRAAMAEDLGSALVVNF